MGLLSTIGAASGRAFGLTRLSAAIKDAYFNLTTLLLPGNGTNGAQNNTFLDSSSNNFTITRNGNTTQGTFSPFSQTGWGNYFDDSSIKTSTAAVALGTSEFSIEAFIYLIDDSSNGWTGNRTSAGSNEFSSRMTDTTISIGKSSSGTYNSQLTTGTLSSMKNKWVHVVICRSSGTTSIFVDGTRQATTSTSIDWSSSRNFAIGFDYSDTTTVNWTGYISNYRMVTGASAYNAGSSTITVPTSILSAITSTKILTSQSNRFVDNSGNNYEFTITGTPSVQAFSPFAPTAAYSTSAVGGSGYFDGNGDYLTWTGSTVGTGAYTVEAWFYTTTFGASQTIVGPNSTANGGLGINVASSTSISIDNYGIAANNFTVPTMAANAWNHLVVVRNSSGTTTVFVNGVRSSTGTITDNNNYGSLKSVGYTSSAVNRYFNGYLAGVKYDNTNTYDPTQSTITVPTAPKTAGANTQLLLNYTNAGITDAAAKNDLETVGNAQISTAQSKFGGSSMLFNGTSDGLLFPSNQNLTLGSGDFTIEGWVRFTANLPYKDGDNNYSACFFGQPQTGGLAIVFKSGTASGTPTSINYTIIGTSTTSRTVSLSNNVWYHVAVSRSSGTVYMFIDGALQGTSFANTTTFTTGTCQIGYLNLTSFLDYFPGYIDDLRVTKGLGRYTTAFTPPTAAFPLQ